jgi:FdhD protein
MKIIGQTKTLPVIEEVTVTRLFNNTDEPEQRKDPVIVEHLLNIIVDGRPCCALTCSPDHLVQLAVGHLFSQGYIDGIDWIDTIKIAKDGSEASVILKPGKNLNKIQTNHIQTPQKTTKAAVPLKLDKDRIFAQAEALYDSADWFLQTGAAHSSSLSFDGVIRYRIADVSRHNTIDKLIGQALMDSADLSSAVLFTSGRIPLDMLLKVARCGIPVVGSRSAPTTAALAMAKKLGIAVVGFVRQGRMNVY